MEPTHAKKRGVFRPKKWGMQSLKIRVIRPKKGVRNKKGVLALTQVGLPNYGMHGAHRDELQRRNYPAM